MSNINLDFVQATQPSFFVHFAYANVTEEMISQTLEALNLGSIREISLKPATNKKNEHGNSIIVHFNQWFRNPTSDKVRQKLISGESIKINYNPKAYLQVIAFQPKVKVPEVKPQAFKQPTITFDDDFGPKLGPDYTEKFNTPKVKSNERPRDERPRQPREEKPRQPRDERPRQLRDERPRDDRPRQPREEKPAQFRLGSDERPAQFRLGSDERPAQFRLGSDERPVKHYRPRTPEAPPPSPEMTTGPKAVVYHYHNTTPDVFDKTEDFVSRGVLLPPSKKRQIKVKEQPKPKPQQQVQIQPRKPINFQDSPSDSEDDDYEEEGEEEFILEELELEDEELQALYGDMGKIDLNK
jgi:hypothetical protein